MAKKFYTGIDLRNQRAINVASPSVATDAANKSYVDSLVNGLSWHAAVDAATTTSGTLSTAFAAGQVIDGHTLVVGNRLLIKNQSTASENGIYVVTADTPTRAPDGEQGDLLPQATVRVEQGTVNGGTQWTMNTPDPITIGSTNLTWVNTTGVFYSAGNGLSLTGTTFAVNPGAGILADGTSTRIDPSVVSRHYASLIGDNSTTSIVVTHNLATRDVSVTIYDASTYEEIEADVTHTTVNTVTVVFAVAPATGAYRCVVQG